MLNIFVNTWGNYNENGADGGEWLTLPMEPDELEEKLKAIAAAMGDNDPEWAIHDYEWTTEIELGDVHEMDSIMEWNEYCQEADALEPWELEEIAAAIEAWDYAFLDAMDRQQRGHFVFYKGQTLEDLAYEFVEDTLACYGAKEIPDIFKTYFDYESYARDLTFDGYHEVTNGVIWEG